MVRKEYYEVLNYLREEIYEIPLTDTFVNGDFTEPFKMTPDLMVPVLKSYISGPLAIDKLRDLLAFAGVGESAIKTFVEELWSSTRRVQRVEAKSAWEGSRSISVGNNPAGMTDVT